METKIALINCGSSKVPLIEQCLTQTKVKFSTISLDLIVEPPPYNGIIISGAPILLTEVDHNYYLQKARNLFSRPIPILGICFGHQLMGLYHGGKITRCLSDRDWQTIELSRPFTLLPQILNSLSQMEDHCEAISLPTSFTCIGHSNTCAVEIMKHDVNPWYGVQFHPESSGESGWELISNFVKLCQKA